MPGSPHNGRSARQFSHRRHTLSGELATPRLLLTQHQIDDPAAANMRLLRIAAVVEDVLAGAARVLEGVRQDERDQLSKEVRATFARVRADVTDRVREATPGPYRGACF